MDLLKLEAEVARERDPVNSALALIDGLLAALSEVPEAGPLLQKIEARRDALAFAVAENTAADPLPSEETWDPCTI